MTAEISHVEFLAGPLDGLHLELPLGVEEFSRQVAFPINDSIFRVIHGQRPGSRAPPTSVAVYELRWKPGARSLSQYVFIGAFSPADIHAAGWRI